MVVDAVCREPVSAENSLLTGKIQGKTAIFIEIRSGRLRKALNKHKQGDAIRTVRSAGYALDLK